MTYREKLEMEHPELVSDIFIGGCAGCPGHIVLCAPIAGKGCSSRGRCDNCWSQEIPETQTNPKDGYLWPKDNPYIPNPDLPNSAIPKPDSDEARKILDSGNRREFGTGAVRDIQEGKGRCDLMPLEVIREYLTNAVFGYLANFLQDNDTDELHNCLMVFADEAYGGCPHTMFLEVAKHFEEGAKKYGEDNWQKGIPTHCYIDSAVRHYLKFLRGDRDEPHDRAFVWNILCCIWTCKHKPELNDYARAKDI